MLVDSRMKEEEKENSKNSNIITVAEEEGLSVSERLESLEEYKTLTELQRKLLSIHFENPYLNQKELAEKAGCKRLSVYKLFHTKAFEAINLELGNIVKTELIPVALRTLKECLNSKSEQVRLQAAVKILSDASILKETPRIDNSKKAIILQWRDGTEVSHTILPASEASGST